MAARVMIPQECVVLQDLFMETLFFNSHDIRSPQLSVDFNFRSLTISISAVPCWFSSTRFIRRRENWGCGKLWAGGG
jgi:hypothetical protein